MWAINVDPLYVTVRSSERDSYCYYICIPRNEVLHPRNLFVTSRTISHTAVWYTLTGLYNIELLLPNA